MVQMCYLAAKRIFDIFLALFGLIISFPLWILISLAIWLEDGRPIFYFKDVLGKKGEKFSQIKFRTMIKDASKKVPIYTSPENGSPYITKAGNMLRKTALDELPQFINILKGDMSFVGPRPYPPIPVQVPNFHLRREIQPGLTGIAQVYLPKLVPLEEMLKLDLEYAKKRNFLLDLKLIFLSFWVTFAGKWENNVKKL